MRRKIHPAAMRLLATDPKVREVTRQAAENVAARARARAPKATGAGAASIHVEEFHKPGDTQFRVSWDKEHFYMLFHEVGTEQIQARPFLRPAARGHISRQRRAIKKAAANPKP